MTLKKVLARNNGTQVRSEEEKQIVKATAHAWFNNHRPVIIGVLGDDQISNIDDLYRELISAAGRTTVRSKYLDCLKQIKKRLDSVQADHAVTLASVAVLPQAATSDTVPKFDPLISDPKMKMILEKRWQECVI